MNTMADQQDAQSRIVYDVLDALGELVRFLGGPKIVGNRMRPELPADQSGQWVRDCLNANRREKFDPSQVMFLLRWGREKGCHVAMHFITEEVGYSKPVPIDPLDEQTKLVRIVQEASETLKRATERLDRLASAPPMRSVPKAAA